MKKISIVFAFVLCVTISTYAQEGFAIKAGLNNVSVDLDLGEFGSDSDSELGFYIGGGYNFEIDDQWDIEPSLLLSFVDDLNSLYIPVMVKYEVATNFNVQAGPQVNYLLEDTDDGAFGLDLAFGAGYQIDANWFVEGRYGFEVSRGGDFGDAVSFNTLTIGAGYRFN
ncbi:hypothetical protein MTsPCn5_36250 [Croceitalea sp. MTPC5]|uniref:porin family protein n=1 Tax=Croceitalea sp. MTPC5 TaxID=3056565 RepID=UPI002B3CD3D6|nr:hypothetical protein MTsPCn5_36250 [Croceitalea sp. MTPC5]